MTMPEVRGPVLPPDHEHDLLLIAGSKPEVARLAPVAAAITAANRYRAITVASGPDPMDVHEAYAELGVPAEVTLIQREPIGPNPAVAAANLLTKIDDLLADLDPTAIMVHGGGVTAMVAAQAAFWRQIPIVHVQAGPASDDLLCPFPQEANRRIIGQLASLFLTTGGAALGSALGPNVLTVGDPVNANPPPSDMRLAELRARVRRDGTPLVLVGLDRPSSDDVLRMLAGMLRREPDVEFVVFGAQAAHDAARDLIGYDRVVVAEQLCFADLVTLVPLSTVLVSDDPLLVVDAPGLGAPAVFVDGPHIPEPGDSIRSIERSRVLSTVSQILAAGTHRIRPPSDGLEAARAEQAVAWMFGLASSPQIAAPRVREDPGGRRSGQ